MTLTEHRSSTAFHKVVWTTANVAVQAHPLMRHDSTMMNQPVSEVVADAVLAVPMEKRAEFLRQMLAYAAAGLVSLEGYPAAAEALYRVADKVAEHCG